MVDQILLKTFITKTIKKSKLLALHLIISHKYIQLIKV
jgi:hypothetical protein